MKIIIAGSRTITNYQVVVTAIEKSGWLPEMTMIISGCARGVDQLALKFAAKHNINTAEFPAEWDKHGKPAGYIRNVQMAKSGDALIAIQRNNSRGTAHMIKTMKKHEKPIYIYKL